MLSRSRLPAEVSIHSASVTTPSAGDTISPGPVGTTRSGSRKNHKKNTASNTGSAVSPPMRQQPYQRGDNPQPQRIKESVTHHILLIIKPRPPPTHTPTHCISLCNPDNLDLASTPQ